MESIAQVVLFIWVAMLLIIIGAVVMAGLLVIGILLAPFLIIAGIFG